MFEDVQMCVRLAARLHFGFALSKDLNRERRSIWVIISRTKLGANNLTTTMTIINTHRTTHTTTHVRLQSEPKLKLNFTLQLQLQPPLQS
jgi:hypothetical protein